MKEEADFKKYYKKGYLEIPVSAKNYIDGDKRDKKVIKVLRKYSTKVPLQEKRFHKL